MTLLWLWAGLAAAEPSRPSIDLPAEKAAAELLTLLKAGADPGEWAHSAAWGGYAHRDGIAAFGQGRASGAEGKLLAFRAFTSAPWDQGDRAKAAEGWARLAAGCRVSGPGRTFDLSPHPAPEVAAFWPYRESVRALASVPLACAEGAAPRALGLAASVKTWSVVAVVQGSDVQAFEAWAEAATHDVPAEREAERQRLQASLSGLAVSGWPTRSPGGKGFAPGDVNGDRRADLLTSSGELLDGAGRPARRLDTTFVVRDVGDVDGDGRTDVMVQGGPAWSVWSGGDPGRAAAVPAGLHGGVPYTALDLDGDRRNELVWASGAVLTMSFGDGRTPATVALPQAAAQLVNLGDLDGDGTDDLAAALEGFGDGRGAIVVVLGAKAGGQPRVLPIVGEWAEGLRAPIGAMDLDGDGKRDVVVRYRDPLKNLNHLVGYSLAGVRLWSVGLARAGLEGDAVVAALAEAPGGAVVSTERREARVWLPGMESGTVVRLPEDSRLALSPTRLGGELGLPVMSQDEVRVFSGTAWTWDAAPAHARPPRPATDAAAAGGVVGGVVGGVNPAAGAGSAPGPKTVHWSEVQVKTKTALPSIPLPPGESSLSCEVSITVDPTGVPSSVTTRRCDPAVFAELQPALLAWRYYPYKGAPQGVRFAFRVTVR